jgi:hypothetical protein
MAEPIPITGAPALRPDARIDILDVNLDIHAAVKCRCDGGGVFLVSANVPGHCRACGTVYVIRAIQIVKPNAQAHTNVALQIGPKDASPIVAPGGPLDGHRH